MHYAMSSRIGLWEYQYFESDETWSELDYCGVIALSPMKHQYNEQKRRHSASTVE